MTTLTHTTDLVVEVCWCGTPHAISKTLQLAARRDGTTVYCPLGHSWSFTESERDRFKQERDQLQARLDEQVKQTAKWRDEAQRISKRAHAGVCPECNRSFQNVARHIKTKHQK